MQDIGFPWKVVSSTFCDRRMAMRNAGKLHPASKKCLLWAILLMVLSVTTYAIGRTSSSRRTRGITGLTARSSDPPRRSCASDASGSAQPWARRSSEPPSSSRFSRRGNPRRRKTWTPPIRDLPVDDPDRPGLKGQAARPRYRQTTRACGESSASTGRSGASAAADPAESRAGEVWGHGAPAAPHFICAPSATSTWASSARAGRARRRPRSPARRARRR